MKRTIYITTFTLLGLAIAVLADGLFQIYMQNYSSSIASADLNQLHSFFQIFLYIACAVWGYRAGKYWWHQLYELKKYKKRWSRHFKWA